MVDMLTIAPKQWKISTPNPPSAGVPQPGLMGPSQGGFPAAPRPSGGGVAYRPLDLAALAAMGAGAGGVRPTAGEQAVLDAQRGIKYQTDALGNYGIPDTTERNEIPWWKTALMSPLKALAASDAAIQWGLTTLMNPENSVANAIDPAHSGWEELKAQAAKGWDFGYGIGGQMRNMLSDKETGGINPLGMLSKPVGYIPTPTNKYTGAWWTNKGGGLAGLMEDAKRAAYFGGTAGVEVATGIPIDFGLGGNAAQATARLGGRIAQTTANEALQRGITGAARAGMNLIKEPSLAGAGADVLRGVARGAGEVSSPLIRNAAPAVGRLLTGPGVGKTVREVLLETFPNQTIESMTRRSFVAPVDDLLDKPIASLVDNAEAMQRLGTFARRGQKDWGRLALEIPFTGKHIAEMPVLSRSLAAAGEKVGDVARAINRFTPMGQYRKVTGSQLGANILRAQARNLEATRRWINGKMSMELKSAVEFVKGELGVNDRQAMDYLQLFGHVKENMRGQAAVDFVRQSGEAPLEWVEGEDVIETVADEATVKASKKAKAATKAKTAAEQATPEPGPVAKGAKRTAKEATVVPLDHNGTPYFVVTKGVFAEIHQSNPDGTVGALVGQRYNINRKDLAQHMENVITGQTTVKEVVQETPSSELGKAVQKGKRAKKLSTKKAATPEDMAAQLIKNAEAADVGIAAQVVQHSSATGSIYHTVIGDDGSTRLLYIDPQTNAMKEIFSIESGAVDDPTVALAAAMTAYEKKLVMAGKTAKQLIAEIDADPITRLIANRHRLALVEQQLSRMIDAIGATDSPWSSLDDIAMEIKASRYREDFKRAALRKLKRLGWEGDEKDISFGVATGILSKLQELGWDGQKATFKTWLKENPQAAADAGYEQWVDEFVGKGQSPVDVMRQTSKHRGILGSFMDAGWDGDRASLTAWMKTNMDKAKKLGWSGQSWDEMLQESTELGYTRPTPKVQKPATRVGTTLEEAKSKAQSRAVSRNLTSEQVTTGPMSRMKGKTIYDVKDEAGEHVVFLMEDKQAKTLHEYTPGSKSAKTKAQHGPSVLSDKIRNKDEYVASLQGSWNEIRTFDFQPKLQQVPYRKGMRDVYFDIREGRLQIQRDFVGGKRSYRYYWVPSPESSRRYPLETAGKHQAFESVAEAKAEFDSLARGVLNGEVTAPMERGNLAREFRKTFSEQKKVVREIPKADFKETIREGLETATYVPIPKEDFGIQTWLGVNIKGDKGEFGILVDPTKTIGLIDTNAGKGGRRLRPILVKERKDGTYMVMDELAGYAGRTFKSPTELVVKNEEGVSFMDTFLRDLAESEEYADDLSAGRMAKRGKKFPKAFRDKYFDFIEGEAPIPLSQEELLKLTDEQIDLIYSHDGLGGERATNINERGPRMFTPQATSDVGMEPGSYQRVQGRPGVYYGEREGVERGARPFSGRTREQVMQQLDMADEMDSPAHRAIVDDNETVARRAHIMDETIAGNPDAAASWDALDLMERKRRIWYTAQQLRENPNQVLSDGTTLISKSDLFGRSPEVQAYSRVSELAQESAEPNPALRGLIERGDMTPSDYALPGKASPTVKANARASEGLRVEPDYTQGFAPRTIQETRPSMESRVVRGTTGIPEVDGEPYYFDLARGTSSTAADRNALNKVNLENRAILEPGYETWQVDPKTGQGSVRPVDQFTMNISGSNMVEPRTGAIAEELAATLQNPEVRKAFMDGLINIEDARKYDNFAMQRPVPNYQAIAGTPATYLGPTRPGQRALPEGELPRLLGEAPANRMLPAIAGPEGTPPGPTDWRFSSGMPESGQWGKAIPEVDPEQVVGEARTTRVVQPNGEFTATAGDNVYTAKPVKGKKGKLNYYEITKNGEVIKKVKPKNRAELDELFDSEIRTQAEVDNLANVLHWERFNEVLAEASQKMGIDIQATPELEQFARDLLAMESRMLDEQAQLEKRVGYAYENIENYSPGMAPAKGQITKREVELENRMADSIQWPTGGQNEELFSLLKRNKAKAGKLKVGTQPFELEKSWDSLTLREQYDDRLPFYSNIGRRTAKRRAIGNRAIADETFLNTVGASLGRQYQLAADGKWYNAVDPREVYTAGQMKAFGNRSLSNKAETIQYVFATEEAQKLVQNIYKGGYQIDPSRVQQFTARWLMPLMMSVRPATIVTNTIGNVDLALREGRLDLASLGEAAKLMLNIIGHGTDDVVTMGEYTMSRTQWVDEFMKRGITAPLEDDPFFAEMGRMDEGLMNLPGLGAYFRTMRKANSTSEDTFRAAVAFNFIKKGGNLDTAAEEANRVLYDYSMTGLSKAEQVIRGFIPFYTWSRRNIPGTASFIARKPRIASFYPKLGPTIEEFNGGTVESYEEKYKNIPAYMREWGSPIMAGSGIVNPRLPLFETVPWIGAANEVATGDTRNALSEVQRQATQMLGPVFKAGSEAFTGRDFETGADMQNMYGQLGPGGSFATSMATNVPFFGGALKALMTGARNEQTQGQYGKPVGQAITDWAGSQVAQQTPKPYQWQQWSDSADIGQNQELTTIIQDTERKRGYDIPSNQADYWATTMNQVYNDFLGGGTPEKKQVALVILGEKAQIEATGQKPTPEDYIRWTDMYWKQAMPTLPLDEVYKDSISKRLSDQRAATYSPLVLSEFDKTRDRYVEQQKQLGYLKALQAKGAQGGWKW